MVAGEVESFCQLVVTFFFGLTLPNYRNKSGSAQPPLISTTSSAADQYLNNNLLHAEWSDAENAIEKKIRM